MKAAEETVKEGLEWEKIENKNWEIDYGPGSSNDEEEGVAEEVKREENSDTDNSEDERAYYARINQKIVGQMDQNEGEGNLIIKNPE